MINDFLDSLNSLERSAARLTVRQQEWMRVKPVLTGHAVGGTLNVSYVYDKTRGSMKHIESAEQKRIARKERARQNEAVLKLYGLYKPKPIRGINETFTYIYYVDFSNSVGRGCYATHKALKTSYYW